MAIRYTTCTILFLQGVVFLSQIYAQNWFKNMTSLLATNGYEAVPVVELGQISSWDSLFRDEACGLNTQILLGERVHIIKTHIDKAGEQWAEVELLDQPTYRQGVWGAKTCFIRQQYCCSRVAGWEANARIIGMSVPVYASKNIKSVQLGVLSMGTPIRVKNSALYGWVEIELASGLVGNVAAGDVEADNSLARMSVGTRRALVVKAASKFEGKPYRWGMCGCDVDCSGLVLRAYQAIGLNVPRDAHDQFMAAHPVQFGKDLQPGDLVFLAKINSEQKTVRVNHVMMVVKENLLIEATGMQCYSSEQFKALSEFDKTQVCTRLIISGDHKRLQKKLRDFWHGQMTSKGELIFFGTFLGDDKTRKQLEKGLLV